MAAAAAVVLLLVLFTKVPETRGRMGSARSPTLSTATSKGFPMTSAAFLEDFHHVATIGATPDNGVDRQAATPEDAQTRHWFAGWVREAEWELRVDGIGNMFGLLEWTRGALCADRIPSGQPAARGPVRRRVPCRRRPARARRLDAEVRRAGPRSDSDLAVVDWLNEEGAGSRRASWEVRCLRDSCSGNRCWMWRTCKASQSVRRWTASGTSARLTGPRRPATPRSTSARRVLEREGISIGLVDSSWYTQKLDIEVLGEQSHTGATAMADRHDALVAASKIILMVHDVTAEFAEEALVSSVGQLTLEPNSPIVVARRVHLVADLRSGDPDIVKAARAKLIEDIDALAREHDIKVNGRTSTSGRSAASPKAGLNSRTRWLRDLGLSARRIRPWPATTPLP